MRPDRLRGSDSRARACGTLAQRRRNRRARGMTIGRLARAFALVPGLLACSSRTSAPSSPSESLRFGPASVTDDDWLVEIGLPARADAETEVRDRASGMRVGVRLKDARPEAAVLTS